MSARPRKGPAPPQAYYSRFSKPSGPTSHCAGCSLETVGQGFVYPSGPESSPILFLGESPGGEELKSGVPFVGPAGSMHTRILQMMGKDRDSFRYDNLGRCLPPGLSVGGTPYEIDVVQRCRYRDAQLSNPNHRVVVTLGQVATHGLLGDVGPIEDLHGTVHRWGDKWVVPSYHTSFLQRGAHNLIGTSVFDHQRAFEVVERGWQDDPASIVEDPPVEWFEEWVNMTCTAAVAQPGTIWVSLDIETPDKAGGRSEGELGPDDQSYQVLRVNVSCNLDEGVTVPYAGPYIQLLQRLFDAPIIPLLWNEDYDLPRLTNAGHRLPPLTYDGMEMVHLLQSDIPRGLGFWAPFYSRFGAWKHLDDSRPAYYAAVDSLQTTRVCTGAAQDLMRQGQWDIFLRHVVDVKRYALRPATEIGLGINEGKLDAFIEKLSGYARTFMHDAQAMVPDELRPLFPKDGYKQPPAGPFSKATELKRDGTAKKDPGDPLKRELYGRAELVEKTVITKVQTCAVCSAIQVAKTHRCDASRVAPWADADGKLLQPIVIEQVATVQRWFWKEPLNPDSRDQVMAYVIHRGHEPGRNKKTGNDSVDRKTLEKLAAKHKDPFYKLLMDLRAVQKVRGTYGIGIKRRLRQGRVHGRFTFKPSTQRLSSVDPNLTNVVADKGGKDTLAAGFRDCVEAAPGCELHEYDFAGIEAKLTGYFASDPAYIRLATLGVHACLAYHVLGQPPDLSQPDEVLAKQFAEMKASGGPPEDPKLYDRSKRTCHGVAYGLTPHGAAETFPESFSSVAEAEKMFKIFYEQLAPGVRKFHRTKQTLAQNQHYLGGSDHPYHYKHWFWSVLSYKMITPAQASARERKGGWVTRFNNRCYAVGWGEDSKRCIAFYPQSTAAGILKEAMLKLFTPGSPWYIGDVFYGRTPLRAPIHDSLLLEVPVEYREYVQERVFAVMQAPIPELPLPAEWGMGSHLAIGVDGKMGVNWGAMKKMARIVAPIATEVAMDDAVTIEDEDDAELPGSMTTEVPQEAPLG